MTTTSATETLTPRRPRIRFGTISWGLITGGGATALLVLLLTPGSRSGLAQWVIDLTPGGAILLAVIGAGAIVLLLGLLAVIRGVQVRASRAASTDRLTDDSSDAPLT